MHIAESIAEACRQSWPILDVSVLCFGHFSDEIPSPRKPPRYKITLDLPLKPQPQAGPKKWKHAKIWIGDIKIYGEKILLSISQSVTYENVLSDPTSLDKLFTILDAHIEDVKGIVPDKFKHISNDPTILELSARKIRAAYMLPTKLVIKRWNTSYDGSPIGIPEEGDVEYLRKMSD